MMNEIACVRITAHPEAKDNFLTSVSPLATTQPSSGIRESMEEISHANPREKWRTMDPSDSAGVASTAPSELIGPVPRKVRLSDGDAPYLVLIVLLFFVGGGLWLGWKGYDDVQQFKHRALLRSSGRVVIGEVTGFSFGRYTPMSVVYRFAVNGDGYSGKALEPEKPGLGTSFDKGDKIPVRFLPSDPSINHPDAWEWSANIGRWFVGFQIFFWSLGAWALLFLLRDRRLARNGSVATAVVTECRPDDRRFRVEYRFRTADGVEMKGHSDSPDEYGVGATIWVLYLPQRPQRNNMYPLPLFDVVE